MLPVKLTRSKPGVAGELAVRFLCASNLSPDVVPLVSVRGEQEIAKRNASVTTVVFINLSFASKVRSVVYAIAISLAPWLQPGDPRELFFFQPFQRFSRLGKPLKRLGTVEIAADHRAKATVLMRLLREVPTF